MSELIDLIQAIEAERPRPAPDAVIVEPGPDWSELANMVRAQVHGIVVDLAFVALRELLSMIRRYNELYAAYWAEIDDTAEYLGRLEGAYAEIRTLRERVADLEQRLAQRPVNPSVTIPAQDITVRAPLQQEILRAIAAGLGRSWRIGDRMIAQGLASDRSSFLNALQKLTGRGLIADYQERGRAIRWTPTAGGGRRLVILTDAGRAWCESAFGYPPAESELLGIARRHGISHGVGILEAADYFRAAGYEVDSAPEAILAGPERWGPRAEPDLVIIADGMRWPVEVQREVSERLTDKWRKTLELAGCLVIVLFNEEARENQARILKRAGVGNVVLLSLEAMERGGIELLPG
jgi:hypothetical protein